MGHGMEPAVTQKVWRTPSQAISCGLNSRTNSPLGTSRQAHTPVYGTNLGNKHQSAPKVLVVEDDPDILMALQDLLEFEGIRVDCVQTCRQAFSSIEQNVYDAVLLDLGLPDGDGLSVLEKLHASNPSLPVIVLTASNRDLGPLRAYARLAKPWNRQELCATLHRAISTAPSSPEN
ncbi:MAG: response regulator [Nitrospira sp.]|nr:response regulator [Nitrospira sp.]